MTTAVGDPRVVLVYVKEDPDASVVKKDDVAEWLAILGDVEHVKLQYDALRKTSCFSVTFKQARTAQQAVEHLDGQRLKGCTVDIRSSTYQRVRSENESTAEGPQGNARKPQTVAPIVLKELPDNHRVPKDVRMDVELVALLPSLTADGQLFPDAAALWEQLRASQSQLAGLTDELDVCAAALASADTTLTERIRGHTSAQTSAAQAAVSAGCVFQTTMPIPFHKASPTSLVAFLSEWFGPLSVPLFVPFLGESGAFAVTVQFWQPQDARRFAIVSQREEESSHDLKRRRTEETAEDTDHAETPLRALDRDRLNIVRAARFVPVQGPRSSPVPPTSAANAVARQGWRDCLWA